MQFRCQYRACSSWVRLPQMSGMAWRFPVFGEFMVVAKLGIQESFLWGYVAEHEFAIFPPRRSHALQAEGSLNNSPRFATGSLYPEQMFGRS